METRLSWSETHLESSLDRRFLNYFTSQVANCLTLPGPVARTWANIVPALALSTDNLHLFHALLAVSAAYRVSQCPLDFDSLDQSNIHYGHCLSILRTLDLNGPETSATGTLAAIMLLCWHEVYHIFGITYIILGSLSAQRKSCARSALFSLS